MDAEHIRNLVDLDGFYWATSTRPESLGEFSVATSEKELEADDAFDLPEGLDIYVDGSLSDLVDTLLAQLLVEDEPPEVIEEWAQVLRHAADDLEAGVAIIESESITVNQPGGKYPVTLPRAKERRGSEG